jgi:hypothetical protein
MHLMMRFAANEAGAPWDRESGQRFPILKNRRFEDLGAQTHILTLAPPGATVADGRIGRTLLHVAWGGSVSF